MKVEKSNNFDGFMTYTMADGWTQLVDADGKAVNGVFYREVTATTADTSFSVLSGDQVRVLGTVTKTQMENIKNGGIAAPTLTFTAYAVQKDNVADAATAWSKL